MRNTTLCYIERGEQYLMLHRVKKEHDLNHDKWVGIGGKFERDETPDECLLREAQEETGLTLTDWRCRGVVTFLSDEWEGEYMYLFTATGFTGTLRECDEGDLEWVDKAAVPSPTAMLSLSPKVTGVTPLASILSRAMSLSSSTPTMVA